MLLHLYAVRRDDRAIRQLTDRYLPLVYRAAMRQTREAGRAEDVTQAVFLLLCQQAEKLVNHTCLAAWLFTTTRNVARTAIRSERRRVRNEGRAAARQENAAMAAFMQPKSREWEHLEDHLDDALARLSGPDRDLLLLRFYRGMDFPEAAAELGVTEVAARRRLSRAVEKLREYFADRQLVPSADFLAVALGAAASVAEEMPPEVSAATVLAPTTAAATLAEATARTLLLKAVLVKVALPVAMAGTAATSAVVVSHWGDGPGAVAVNVSPAAQVTMASPAPVTPVTPPAVALPRAVAPRVGGAGATLPSSQRYRYEDLLPVVARDAAVESYPIPAGWPKALPGQIVGSPVAADLDGNGKPYLVVCVVHRDANVALVHPRPNPVAMVYAIRPDGFVPPGWPAELPTPAVPSTQTTPWGAWACSPSVFRDPTTGKDTVVIQGALRQAYFLRKDGSLNPIRGGNFHSNVPLADVDGDGVLDILTNTTVINVNRGPVSTWPAERKFKNGYAPAVADANGDGLPEVYHLFYAAPATTKDSTAPRLADLGGYDRFGALITTDGVYSHWPRRVTTPSWHPPVVGDILGDGKKEVVGAFGDNLFAFAWDGADLPGTTTVGPVTGVFKAGVKANTSSPALADLDGDGKAEVIVYDQNTGTLRAWHGDGRSAAASADGVLATLPTCHGVTVADVGDNGLVDLFAGAYWVKYDPNSRTATVTDMLPGDPAIEHTQPTLCDLDADGKTDVLFGTSDGRVVVYRTGLRHVPGAMQWATNQGNLRRTGEWEPPRRP